MSEELMPAVEVENDEMDSPELHSYELAFHVLPTIAEGEVNEVFEKIKATIKKSGGEIFDEEVPERFELAYEVVKHLEDKNRKFRSAYFGWVRFKTIASDAVAINAEISGNNVILRQLLLKLTRVEEENPFRFHDAIRDQKMVTDIDEPSAVVDEVTADSGEVADTSEEVEVEKEDLDETPEKKEV